MKKIFFLILTFLFLQIKVFANEDIIKVVFTIDKKFPIYTMIAIDSILQNNKSDSKYIFYIVTNNLPMYSRLQMKHFVENRHQKIKFIDIDTNIIDKGHDYYKLTQNSNSSIRHVPKISEARLYLSEILKNEDKILYLDADIIVNTDLKPLWNTNLGDYPIAMCPDVFKYIKKRFQEKPSVYSSFKYEDDYCNAGLMLIDIKKMRKEHWTEKLIDELNNHPEYFFHDQDVINNVLHGNIKILPEKWLMIVDGLWPLGKTPKKGIYHYIGTRKPWSFNPWTNGIRDYRIYQNLYMHYWNKSYLKIYIPYHMIKGLRDLYFSTLKFEGLYYSDILFKHTNKNIEQKFSYQNKIKIAFAIDKNYPVFTMIVIDSILQNNKSNSKYKFYILENNLSKFQKYQMKHFIEKRYQDVEFIHVDTFVIDNGNDYYKYDPKKDNKEKLKHITKISAIRLYLAEILKNENKILYLDGDIIVNTDIKQLWDTNIENYYVAMSPELLKYVKIKYNKIPPIYYGFRYLNDTYYNAGIMLINLEKVRKDGLTVKLIEDYNNHPEYFFHDQDVINNVLHGQIKRLPEKWNIQIDGLWNLSRKTKPAIYHYLGKWKPWLFNPKTYKYYPVYQHLYLSYWNKSYLKIYIPFYMFKGMILQYKEIIPQEIDKLKYIKNYKNHKKIIY